MSSTFRGRRVDPAQPCADHVDQTIGQLLTEAAAVGMAPGEVKVHLSVTVLPDTLVEVVRARAHVAGIGSIVMIDDAIPARPGIVRSSDLPPTATSLLDQAAAARRDIER